MTLLNAILQNDTIKVLVLDNHKSFFEYIKEPNTITAITATFAIIISVVGFFYSVKYNRKSLKQSEEYNRKTLENMIKHNKLSVEPMLYIKSTTLHSVSELEIKLMNGGLGTGIINSIEILYKEERYKSFQFMLDKNMVIQKDKFLFASLGESSLISSNSELPLLRYKAITKDELKSLISILNDIDIKIEYESMYGDKKTI